jgi:hypothetical protein
MRGFTVLQAKKPGIFLKGARESFSPRMTERFGHEEKCPAFTQNFFDNPP